jgi:hypothetical protein
MHSAKKTHQLLVTANVIPNSQILVTLMMEVLHSSEMSVLARGTQSNIVHSQHH